MVLLSWWHQHGNIFWMLRATDECVPPQLLTVHILFVSVQNCKFQNRLAPREAPADILNAHKIVTTDHNFIPFDDCHIGIGGHIDEVNVQARRQRVRHASRFLLRPIDSRRIASSGLFDGHPSPPRLKGGLLLPPSNPAAIRRAGGALSLSQQISHHERQ